MKVWIRVGVSAGVLALLFYFIPWHDLRSAVGRISGAVWFTVLAGFLAGHALGALKWRTLVNAGRSTLSVVDAVRCYAAGLFANMCLPSIVGGDVLRAVLAGKTTGRAEAAVLGGLTDRLVDMAVVAMLVAIGGFFSRDALPGWGVQLMTAAVVIGLITAMIFLPLLLRRPLAKWHRKLRRPVGRALVAIRALTRRPSAALLAISISIVVQGGFVLLNAWMGRAIGVNVPLGVWFLAWPMAKLAGLLPISLGGLGVRDATLAALLVPFGVPAALGFIASLLWQTILIAGGLVAGAVWWILGRRTTVSRSVPESLALRVSAS